MKITYIISKINKAVAFEWIYEALKGDYTLSFILIGNEEGFLYQWLKDRGVEVYFIPYIGKKSLLSSFLKTLRILRRIKPSIVHTHLFDANLIGLAAAKLLRIPKRIYTRHHATYHHKYFPHAVKWDKLSNKMATHIVAITKTVQNILIEMENVPSSKITLIEHGFKLDLFSDISQERIQAIYDKYHIPKDKIVIGAISRYIKLKGIYHLIEAYQELYKNNTNLHLILANANGPEATNVKKMLQNLPKDSYTEIAFENDLFALYQLFDVFIHCPIDNKVEAFGQTYVEALAAGVPSVFTLSGIANDFIINRKNALVVEYENSSAIAQAVIELINDKKLAKTISTEGYNNIEQFSLEQMILKLKKLYNL